MSEFTDEQIAAEEDRALNAAIEEFWGEFYFGVDEDSENLDEAIDDVDEIYSYIKGDYFDEKWGLGEKAERVKGLLRLLANGERVEWCETHDSEGQTPEKAGTGYVPGLCFGAIGGPDSDKACRIVSRLLVDPPKEEER